jgi:hypothetical protein
MLSKCANPECSEILRYLHQGKIFCLAPTPEIETLSAEPSPQLHERFWLCDQCSKKLTLVWAGTEVKLVPIAVQPGTPPTERKKVKSDFQKRRPRVRTASVYGDDQ